MSIGVVIGRFQVASLHEGHVALLSAVQARHTRLVVLVGTAAAKQPDKNDPLPFFCRHDAIRTVFPQATVLPIQDYEDDAVWSLAVDTVLAPLNERCTIYGGRSNSLGVYTGRWPVETLNLQSSISGTEVRAATSLGASLEFRTGMIYASQTRFPVSYQAVDIAILSSEAPAVLLGKRHATDKLYRFPGGFVDPSDASLEAAAAREAREECGTMELEPLVYVGSMRINDWRYRSSADKIMSSLFKTVKLWGKEQAGDDLGLVSWIDLNDVPNVIHPAHRGLFNLLMEAKHDN